jgi:hypothetical protein
VSESDSVDVNPLYPGVKYLEKKLVGDLMGFIQLLRCNLVIKRLLPFWKCVHVMSDTGPLHQC